MKKIMVCVTGQLSCERLMKFGNNLSTSSEDKIIAIHVAQNDDSLLLNTTTELSEYDALEYLFNISGNYNAEMVIIRASSISAKIASYARKNNITDIVMGSPPAESYNIAPNIAFNVRQLLPDARIHIVSSLDDSLSTSKLEDSFSLHRKTKKRQKIKV